MNTSYPAQYESRLTLKDGRTVFLRPILQTDESLLVNLLNKLSPDAIYLRFLRPVSSLPEEMLHHLTHINYTTNFALVAVIEEEGRDALVAVARYGYDRDERSTDFAIVVRDDWQHHGLGKLLLKKIFAIGREHGISRFVSVIDSTNQIMKQILRELDFTVKYSYKGGAIQVEIFV
ncbi:MAG: GNAT family N-acetyltransferase [Deltaproteobacteria bacterium]